MKRRWLIAGGMSVALFTVSGQELDAASIRVIEGEVDLHFDGELNYDPWEMRETSDIAFPDAQVRTLRYVHDYEREPYTEYETFARVSYDLREESGGAQLDVLSHLQKGFFVHEFPLDEERWGTIDFRTLVNFSLTFETEEALDYRFEVDVPDLTRFTMFYAAFNDHEAGASNDHYRTEPWVGFPERFVDRGDYSYYEIAGPMVVSGTLPPGIHTLVLRMSGYDNEVLKGSGGMHLTLSPTGAVVPTPAAAGAGLLLLGLGALRRRSDRR